MIPTREPWHRRFQGLMPHRVREILLVSSEYDAFVLEEDGPLTERLFTGYSELNLTSAPRFTHVTTAGQALKLLEERRFDLVITVVRVEDGDAGELSLAVKDRFPDLPVVLLLFDEADLAQFPDRAVPETIDRSFLWTGDAGALIAAIKLVEDLRNVHHDTNNANVQVILVVEDSLRAYSTFLGFLYPELLSHSQSLIQDGYNDLHRLVRMRARPKILLANDYEEARVWFRWFREHMLAVITDIRFPKAGRETEDAGLQLIREIRSEQPDVAVLAVSSERGIEQSLQELRAWSVEKASPAFPTQVRRFLSEALGFGDFVFRLPDGTETARARSVYEMEQAIRRVPAEAIEHHAARLDFSVWLKARAMFDLASEIRARSFAELGDTEAARQYLVDVLQRARAEEQDGVISDVSATSPATESRFVRVGRGSIGGKGRSIAFLSAVIARHGLFDHFPGLQIRIPKTVALSTEAFERFIDHNAESIGPDDQRADLGRWLDATFDPELEAQLEAACRGLKGPLAVRSSSVLEDSRFQPFAGVYSTYMLPNTHPHPHVRFRQILKAIKAVYASAFSETARTYVAGTPHGLEDQRMAVVIQRVVGQQHRKHWYPLISGVAQSWNYYPLGPQQADQGVATVALGLGETVVRGETALRFSPGCPRVLPQFPSARAFSKLSQRQFYAIDLARDEIPLSEEPAATLVKSDLEVAEGDSTLSMVGSVYCAQDDVLRDNLKLPGPRVVSLSSVLRYNAFPLPEALSALLQVLRNAMGGELEIEFAVDGLSKNRPPRLYLLQLRPMPPHHQQTTQVDPARFEGSRILLRSDRSLGHGIVSGVRDIVYVKQTDLTAAAARQAGAELQPVTADLRDANRPFMLVGPGRWGTADPALGIPVSWRDISGAKLIVETPLGQRHVEPSQGSHFFHNVTALRIGYITLEEGSESSIDRAWLDGQPAAHESALIRHVRLEDELEVHMDGLLGRALILKPGRTHPS